MTSDVGAGIMVPASVTHDVISKSKCTTAFLRLRQVYRDVTRHFGAQLVSYVSLFKLNCWVNFLHESSFSLNLLSVYN